MDICSNNPLDQQVHNLPTRTKAGIHISHYFIYNSNIKHTSPPWLTAATGVIGNRSFLSIISFRVFLQNIPGKNLTGKSKWQ